MELCDVWLKKARVDLKAASSMLKEDLDDYLIAYYHLQQAIEKSLKAILVFKGQPVAKTHDLTVLCDLVEPFVISFPDCKEQVVNLTWFEANGRYPIEIDNDDYSEEFDEYAKLTNEFYVWAESNC